MYENVFPLESETGEPAEAETGATQSTAEAMASKAKEGIASKQEAHEEIRSFVPSGYLWHPPDYRIHWAP